ncbi:MAG: polysaccharide biosynthesis/export family protein, partial [Acidobacteriota bacterium]
TKRVTSLRSLRWSNFARIGSVSLVAGLCGLLNLGYAQQKQPQPNAPATQAVPEKSTPSTFVPPGENNRISPGDTLTIAIDDAPELSKNYHVSAEGVITMPFLGTVLAQRLTTEKLAQDIAAVLRKEDYLKRPQVTVTVAQFYTDSYFVQGAVRSPGVYLVRSQPSLFWLISLAGGLADNHGSIALILRPIKPQVAPEFGGSEKAASSQQADIRDTIAPIAEARDGNPTMGRDEYQVIRINLTNIYQGRFEQNLRIEPGDIIHIPRSDVFFVAGEVHAPGSFQLKDGTTLRQAISLAQGTTFKARLGDTIIFRDDTQTGKREEIKVDVAAVMSGKKEDVPILANDIIIIPNSRMKTVGGSLLMTLGTNAMRFPIP